MLRWLPLRAAYVLVLPLVLMWFIHYNHPRISVQRALARMGKRHTLVHAFRAYVAYAFTLVERWYMHAGRLKPSMQEADSGRGFRLIEEEVAEPGPLVFLGGHCGALEFGASALETLSRPVRGVAVRDPGAGALLSGVGDPADRVGLGSTIVADGSVASGLRMLKALRRGEVLCFKADRVLPGAADASVAVDFFGEQVRFPGGPVKVALTARARVVVVSVFRSGPERYRVVADRLDLSGRNVEEITRRFAAALESQVREQPHQWFNFYPYWPSDSEAMRSQPEVVPLSARAAEHALWGAVATSVALGLLDSVLGGGLIWAPPADGGGGAWVLRMGMISWGLVAGIGAGGAGIVLGAEKQRDGSRNKLAHAQAAVAPLFAAVGPALLGGGLLQSGDAPGALSALAAAVAAGWLGATLGPRFRRTVFASLVLVWLGSSLA